MPDCVFTGWQAVAAALATLLTTVIGALTYFIWEVRKYVPKLVEELMDITISRLEHLQQSVDEVKNGVNGHSSSSDNP